VKARIVTRGPTSSDETFDVVLSGKLELHVVSHDGEVATSVERSWNLSEVETIELSDWPEPPPPAPPPVEMETVIVTKGEARFGPLAPMMAEHVPGLGAEAFRYKRPKQPAPAKKTRAK
jgi:hypothetical protein